MFETYELKNFGERIKKTRKSLGYSQSEVCRGADINRDTLSKIENGHGIATFDTLNKLSAFFKKDLLHELAHYNTDRTLLNYYDRIDNIINSYDYGKLVNLSNDFEAHFKNNFPCDFSLYESKLIEQFRLIVKGIEALHKENIDYEYIRSIFIESMRLTVTDFALDDFSKLNYNLFELRILLLIALTLQKDENYTLSINILSYILESLSFDKETLFSEKKLVIKVIFNISYNYHYTDNHKKALEYAVKGIEYCRDQDIMYALNHLYYRRGIAEYLLDKEEKVYKDSINKSIHILEIKGYYDLSKKYKEITKNRYGIDLN